MYFEVINLNETKSTNLYAQELIAKQDCNEGLVISTLNQTHGKGQGNNKWNSSIGENITASWILKPNFLIPSQQFLINQVVSLAVSDCLFEIEEINTCIKWPNDIYYKLLKIAGILIEHIIEGNQIKYSIIGIGVNINQENFPKDLPNPVSLKNITKKNYNLNDILLKLSENINKRYEYLKARQFDIIKNDYSNRILFIEEYRVFIVKGEKAEAKIIGINDDGRLILSLKNNKKLYFAMNEVSYCIV